MYYSNILWLDLARRLTWSKYFRFPQVRASPVGMSWPISRFLACSSHLGSYCLKENAGGVLLYWWYQRSLLFWSALRVSTLETTGQAMCWDLTLSEVSYLALRSGFISN